MELENSLEYDFVFLGVLATSPMKTQGFPSLFASAQNPLYYS
jgi:hypothetical protein